MRVSVKIKLKSREERCEESGENSFLVFVKEPPIDGRANKAAVRILSDYFGVSESQVKIISGFKSREKIIEII